ncbi:MAG: cation diffusion facilitator family transporter [Syntrophales bacterium]|jgi:cation diffusion facilitator family transporter|nr:cation diffusion facilitator family transporter [Syntrophales bacterium]
MKQEITADHIGQIKRVTWTGLFVNVALAALKFIVGFVGASQAVIADAVHTLSDIATDFSVIVGVRYWSAPPDEDHPYGHRKIETIITVLIGAALVIVALGLGYKALSTIRHPHIRQTAWIAITGPILSIILKEILYRWTVIVGTRVKSTAVIANAWHHRSDAFSSVPAVMAVAASAMNPDWAFVDHVGALIISVFILKVSWDIMSPSLAELADRGASLKDCAKIERIAMDVNGVRGVHAIRTRKCGESLFVDLHVVVDPEISVRLGHNISEEVKGALLKGGPRILDVVAHLEPDE